MKRDQSTINREITIWARVESLKQLQNNHRREWEQLNHKLKYNHPKYKVIQPNKKEVGKTKTDIINFLKKHPKSLIKDILKVIDICQPMLSQHLRELQDKGIVSYSRLNTLGQPKIWELTK